MKPVCLICSLILFSIFVQGQPKDNTYVLLVSFDGFRFDYAEKFNAPNFKSIAKKGSRAEGLIPSFPSKTFPNHYTIVTGLYPGNHGLVDNVFYDPGREEFYSLKNRERVTDPYYYRGTPLWQLARQHGIKSASMFWTGSELPQPDLHPDYHYAYQESMPDSIRIQQVLSWLKLPADKRPRFITLYFSSPDHEGHEYGPDGIQTKNAVLRADANLGMILKGLEQIQLPVNVVIVSDHGMEELKPVADSYIFLDEILDHKNASVKIANGGTQAHLYVKSQKVADSLYSAIKRSPGFTVLRQRDFPERWHYNDPRAGDLLIVARPGFYIVDQPRKTYIRKLPLGHSKGAHGYDAQATRTMHGIFYAFGPNVRAGKVIPAFQNIHIYPFMAEILGLPIPRIDGDLEVLEPILIR
jgi:alkaline phosphatase D